MGIPANEYGFAICRTPAGRLVQGPTAWGTPTSVSIPLGCPAGSTFLGLFHTHPGGTAYPSEQDLKSAVAVAARILCIESDKDGLRCFRIA